jgi:hypothetical protein
MAGLNCPQSVIDEWLRPGSLELLIRGIPGEAAVVKVQTLPTGLPPSIATLPVRQRSTRTRSNGQLDRRRLCVPTSTIFTNSHSEDAATPTMMGDVVRSPCVIPSFNWSASLRPNLSEEISALSPEYCGKNRPFNVRMGSSGRLTTQDGRWISWTLQIAVAVIHANRLIRCRMTVTPRPICA